MIWLTWRQFRVQALIAVGALAALTAYLGYLGVAIRDTYDTYATCTGCTAASASNILEAKYTTPLLLIGFLLVIVPVVIGVFWGAPLISREIETGTHRLVWTQSVTRTHWLAVKLGILALAGILVTGALSLLLTWAASPFDKVINDRFGVLTFPTRNVAPLGYELFAVVLGIVVGLLARRTVPAMAITLVAFAALQILVPTLVRPHLEAPVTDVVTLAGSTESHGLMASDNGVFIEGYTLPGSWMMSDEVKLLDSAGTPITKAVLVECAAGDMEKDLACLAAKNLHFEVTYQPANRYWTFQWLETAGYLLLAGLLAGFAFWRIRRGLT